MDPDTVRIGEASRLLGVSIERVRLLADTGRLRCSRSTDGHRLLERAQVLAMAAQRAEERAAVLAVRRRYAKAAEPKAS